MRKRIFLAVSTSDLATRNRIFFPPCRIRSTALKPGRGGCWRRACVVGMHHRPSRRAGETGGASGGAWAGGPPRHPAVTHGAPPPWGAPGGAAVSSEVEGAGP